MSDRDPLIAVVRVFSGETLGATTCEIGIWLESPENPA
jgi:hypothetical protein